MTMGSGSDDQVLTMGDLLTNYLAIAKRGSKYWKRGTALFLLIIIPGMYWVSTHARVFRSEAQFQVQAPDTPNAPEQDMDTIQRSLENRAGHVYDSRVNILQVIRELNLYPQLQGTMSREKIVAYFQGAFTFRVDHDTIKIGFSYKDAATAQRVVQRLVRLFTEERRSAAEERAQTSLSTINSQLEQLETTLSAKEDSLERFTLANQANVDTIRMRRAGGVAAPNAPAENRNDPTASPATRRLRTRISELQRRIDTMRNPGAPAPANSEEPESVRTLRASVASQRDTVAGLQARGLTPEHPQMLSAQRRLAELQNQLNGEVARSRSVPSPVGMSDAERQSQIESLQREIASTRAQLSASESNDHAGTAQPAAPTPPARNPLTLTSYPEVEAQYDRLIADLTTTRNAYQEMLQRKFQVQADLSRIQVAGGEQIRMIDPPSLPVEPEPPGKAKLGMIVGLVAVVLGLGVSLISGFLDTRVYDQGDLVRWGELPALPFIPELHADGAPRAPVSPPGTGIPQTPV